MKYHFMSLLVTVNTTSLVGARCMRSTNFAAGHVVVTALVSYYKSTDVATLTKLLYIKFYYSSLQYCMLAGVVSFVMNNSLMVISDLQNALFCADLKSVRQKR